MPVFPVPSGQLAGMMQPQLLDLRAKLQGALFTLALGKTVAAASYTQGDGAKSVTFTMTSPDNVRALLRQVNAALGVSGRRAIGVIFR